MCHLLKIYFLHKNTVHISTKLFFRFLPQRTAQTMYGMQKAVSSDKAADRLGSVRFPALIYLGQHRTIAPSSLSRLFAPLLQFPKWEIHTVFLHFWNFELEQKFWLRLLVELCGDALGVSLSGFCQRYSLINFVQKTCFDRNSGFPAISYCRSSSSSIGVSASVLR